MAYRKKEFPGGEFSLLQTAPGLTGAVLYVDQMLISLSWSESDCFSLERSYNFGRGH